MFSVCMCEWESEYVSVSPNVCFRSVYASVSPNVCFESVY